MLVDVYADAKPAVAADLLQLGAFAAAAFKDVTASRSGFSEGDQAGMTFDITAGFFSAIIVKRMIRRHV